MKRVLISLAASAAILSLSTGAYACSKLDTSSNDNGKSELIILAQATAPSGGPAATTPEEQTGGKRKTETDPPAPPANPNATDTTGAPGTVDASQSKRKDTAEPAQSGAK